ncbi:MAG: PAS domain S-box protein [Patescibacteria group bacterium]|jgi:PAS domain S-box-containing protein
MEAGKKEGEFRCQKCSRLLAKGELYSASLAIKCGRCGSVNSILEAIADMVIITDIDGVIHFANGQVEAMTGYTIEEVIGQRPSLWGGQMDIQFYKNLWLEVKIHKRPIAVWVINRRKDGTQYTAALRISPVLDSSGTLKFFVGMESLVRPTITI